MLRFFRDTRDGESIIYDAAKSILSSRRGDAVVHRTSTCFTADDRLSLTNWRELPPAEFLRETRGTAIADKALELLAAERGVVCYSWPHYESYWIVGKGRFLYYAAKPKSMQTFTATDGDPIREDIERSSVIDLPTILASEPGKKHREQIEAFILGLPVGGEKPKVECWKRTRPFQSSYLRFGGRLYVVSKSLFAVSLHDESPAGLTPCTLPELIAEYAAYPDIVARIRELTGEPVAKDEPEAEAVKRVRCFTARYAEGGALVVVSENGDNSGTVPRGWYQSDASPNGRANLANWAVIPCAYEPMDERDFRQKYAGTPIIAKLDQLLRETGEYVEPEAERGDYVIVSENPGGRLMVDGEMLQSYTLQEAESALRETIRGFNGATLALRPLGPAILTLRSVEKTTWEVEEVKSCAK